MNPPKSIAYYLRVSRNRQEHASQMHAVRQKIRRERWQPMTKGNTFAEKITGASSTRRELDRLLQACRDGKFDAIVTYRADRLGRSFPHLAQLDAELTNLKVRLVGVGDHIDTAIDSPTLKAFRHMLYVHAEMTRELIVENIKHGQAAARRAGRVPGRPRVDADKIENARALAKSCTSLAELSEKTGVSLATLSRHGFGKARGRGRPAKSKTTA